MRTLHGFRASSGIAMGPARWLPPPIHVEERRVSEDRIGDELDRFEAAIATTDAAMEQIGRTSKAPQVVGTEMVDTHRAILKSDEIVQETRVLIRERRLGAEWAVRLVVEELRPVFAAMSDARFRERFEDVESVADRLLRTLLELPGLQPENLAGAVGVALEVSPLDALQLHRTGIVALVTERGGPTSHTAIVARALGMPYVFGVDRLVEGVRPGEALCVDGTHGEVVVDPDLATQELFARRRMAETERRHAVEATCDEPAVTLDGARVQVGANVESTEEVQKAMAAGADHIGLVRTELLYLDRRELPSEEEQLRDALSILEAARGTPVTFRTLDIGGDKLPVGVRVELGPNPALGVRGIRFSLRRLDVFRTQLRALYRAAAVGPVRIMFPLVSGADEMQKVRAICAEVCGELSQAGLPHDPRAPLGAMIETPSAALTADHIAAECDFLSIGTNDLIHYAFAADRQNDDVAYLNRPLHPSILRMLRQVLEAAAAAGRPVSLCGEMAGDPRFTWMLLGLGLQWFSMNASEIPFVKSVLRKTSLADARRLAVDAQRLDDDRAIEALTAERMGDRFMTELGDPSIPLT